MKSRARLTLVTAAGIQRLAQREKQALRALPIGSVAVKPELPRFLRRFIKR